MDKIIFDYLNLTEGAIVKIKDPAKITRDILPTFPRISIPVKPVIV